MSQPSFTVGQVLLRRVCAGCGRACPRRMSMCASCLSEAQRVGAIHGLPGVDHGGAVLRYGGSVRLGIVAAKSGARRDVLDTFGSLLADLAMQPRFGPFDVVTWIPASAEGRKQRGFDQGRQLAEVVGGRLGVPVQRLLVRRRAQRQVGRGRADRLCGPNLRAPLRVPPDVLVVDDVITTGASMAAAANALRSSGASRVTGLAVAWTATPQEVAAHRPAQKGREAVF